MSYLLACELIVGLCLLGCLTCAQANESDLIYNQLMTFAAAKSQSKPLEPSETLAQLKRLQLLHNEHEPADSRKENIDELVAETQFHLNSCKSDSLANWSRLAKRYEHLANLELYLKHAKHERFAFCQRQFVAGLPEQVARLSERQRSEIGKLRTLVQAKHGQQLDGPFVVLNTGAIAEAALDYLAESNALTDKETSKANFGNVLERAIGELCRAVDRELNTSTVISSYSTGYGDLHERLDRTSKDWITNARICRLYLDNPGQVSAEAFNLSDSANKKSLADKLRARIRSSGRK